MNWKRATENQISKRLKQLREETGAFVCGDCGEVVTDGSCHYARSILPVPLCQHCFIDMMDGRTKAQTPVQIKESLSNEELVLREIFGEYDHLLRNRRGTPQANLDFEFRRKQLEIPRNESRALEVT